MESLRYPPIAEVAQPMLRLAGHRINPRTNGPHLPRQFIAFRLLRIEDGVEIPLKLPRPLRASLPRWSPDGRHFAFTHTTGTGIELWIAEVNTGSTRRLPGIAVNAAHGEALNWMPDSRRLLVQLIPAGRGEPPPRPVAPAGPVVQESAGKAGPVRTFQDMLTSPYDEDLFEHYATAQLALVDAGGGRVSPVGQPAIFLSLDVAPGGRHILVTRVHRPYSYLHTSSAFPREIEVWDSSGKVLYRLASLPLADRVPIEGVPTGPRQATWRPDEPATLVWVEALDGGNPREKAPFRDRVLMLRAPFQGPSVEAVKTPHRYSGMDWFATGGLALVRDYERDRRWSRTYLVDFDERARPPRLIWSRNIQDRYGSPGDPVERTSPAGRRVLVQSGDEIFLAGPGASPEGDRPFLDRYNFKTGQAARLFRSEAGCYERLVAILDQDGKRILTERESSTEPPNLFVRDLTTPDSKPRALTHFADPTPQLRAIRKEKVLYKREDGVQLSFTLYLPPGYKEGTRLPTVVWAYPREFTDPDTAGQVLGSPQRFTLLSGTSHLFFLLAGYAVLDEASMPVVGDPETVNNTYLEQIVMNARAAIDKAVEMGVTDRRRVGVGGHSYGAFMTANLLAHSDLFRAGIARSGAHNRTLTPFGFQSERRTLWEAPEIYLKMSPIMHADKIKEPLLLIHGEADNNPGTFPIQSERMYQAVRGNGGIVRLVLLPHESHAYVARESVEHTLYEMIAWFGRYVKGAD